MPTAGNPRLQIRVSTEVEEQYAALSRAGVSNTQAVTALARSWQKFDAAAGGHGDAKAFITAVLELGQIDPTAAPVDMASLRREVKEEALLDAMRETLRAAEEALAIGVTAAMVVLLEPNGAVVGPAVVETVVHKWFRENTDTIRRILGGSRRLQDWLCGATGRIVGESSQGAWYVEQLLLGEAPGVEVV